MACIADLTKATWMSQEFGPGPRNVHTHTHEMPAARAWQQAAKELMEALKKNCTSTALHLTQNKIQAEAL